MVKLEESLRNDPDPVVQEANRDWDEFVWSMQNGGTFRERARRNIARRKAEEAGAEAITAVCPHCRAVNEVTLYRQRGGPIGWDCPECHWHFEER